MNGNELLKKLRKVAREQGKKILLAKSHGKGSHATLHFGDRKVTMKDLKKEIGPGLLNKILEQIGLTKDDI
jgi:mRNA interferase HicA